MVPKGFEPSEFDCTLFAGGYKGGVSGKYFSYFYMFVCVEVLQPSQPNGVMSSAVSFPDHRFTGQA